MPRDRTPRRQAAAVATFRPKQEDQDGGDSEWEEPEGSSVEEDELDEDDESDEEDQYEDEEEEEEEDIDEPPKKPAAKQSTFRKRKAPVYERDDDEDALPTSARKTAKGGYAHTNRSRARISKANKGNTPWNKGKNRSEAVKAKIAAGVQARNRAVLLEKLKKLGMTEEEWFAKKKEIKYLRERVRKAKIAAAKREDIKNGRKSKSKEQTYAELQDQLAAKLAEQMHQIQPKEEDGNEALIVQEEKQEEGATAPALLQKVFAPDIDWTPHDYDRHDNLYEQLCPTGGPGGLICCQFCVSAYSRYLSQTANDIEVQTIHNIGKEVRELVGFMEETRNKLQDKIGLARRQVPPPSRRGMVQGTAQVASRTGDGNMKTTMGALGPAVRL